VNFTLKIALDSNDNDLESLEVGVVDNLLPDYITLKSRGVNGDFYEIVFEVSPKVKHVGKEEIVILIYTDDGTGYTPDMEESLELRYIVVIEAVNDRPSVALAVVRTGGAYRAVITTSDEETKISGLTINSTLLRNGVEISPHNTDRNAPEYYPLSDGNYTFKVKVTDPDGGSRTKEDSFEIKGISQRNIPAGQWTMVGVLKPAFDPVNFGSSRTIAIWQDDMQNHNLFSKYIMNDDVISLERGKGYWVQLTEAKVIETKQSEFLDAPHTMTLVKGGLGWNQVSNPFPYSVDLTHTKLEFFKWDASTSDVINVGGILEAGEAYWVNVELNKTVKISNTPFFASTTSNKKLARTAPANPQLQLILSAEQYRDTENYIGYSAKNTQILLKNKFEAPKMGRHISLFFTGKKQNQWFSTSYKPEENKGDLWWDFRIHNEKTGVQESQLNFKGLENFVSEGKYVFMVNKGKAVEIIEGVHVQLKLSSKDKYYSIVVTDNPDFVKSLASGHVLNQNYPNPVRNFTTLSFVLPNQWQEDGKRINVSQQVTLDIYGMNGRKIVNVLNKKIKTGSYNIIWSPQGRNGSILPAGTYIYQFQAGPFSQSKKMILIH